MIKFDNKLIDVINKQGLSNYLLKGNFGLEKENVRVDEKGSLALTPHPKAFGDPMTNPYIKKDFSESQVEVATPVSDTIEETYEALEKLHDEVCSQLDGEYLWPQSNPPYIPLDKEIPIAKLGNREEEKFREVLAERYGRKKQLISGIHYNFSFKEEFLLSLYKHLGSKESYKEFKNNIYLKLCRGFLKYRWLPIYLTGASPVFHKTFIEEYVSNSNKLDDETYYFDNMISLRNSDYGYKNKKNYYVSYDSVEKYVKNIDELVEQGEIQDICEYYAPLRLKTGNNDNLANELITIGVKYFEIRILDLNPLCRIGINKDILYIIHLFVLFALFKEEEEFTEDEHNIACMNAEQASLNGRYGNLLIFEDMNTKVSFKGKALNILEDMKELLKLVQCYDDYFNYLIETMKAMIDSPERTFSNRVFEGVKEGSYINFHIEKAKEYLK
jgi:glutamate--cysteine ligase